MAPKLPEPWEGFMAGDQKKKKKSETKNKSPILRHQAKDNQVFLIECTFLQQRAKISSKKVNKTVRMCNG